LALGYNLILFADKVNL